MTMTRPSARRAGHPAIKAGVIYFALVFALGFALGALRELALSPLLGRNIAVLIEAPIMVAASWVICGWALVRFAVPADRASRALMGGLAFLCLMIAEAIVSMLFFDRSLRAHFFYLYSEQNRLGLVAQALFGLIPVLRR